MKTPSKHMVKVKEKLEIGILTRIVIKSEKYQSTANCSTFIISYVRAQQSKQADTKEQRYKTMQTAKQTNRQGDLIIPDEHIIVINQNRNLIKLICPVSTFCLFTFQILVLG